MAQNLTTAEINESLLQAAEELQHQLPPKVRLLLSHREAVAKLRNSKCSYRQIALRLTKLTVNVSYQTVARFCRLVLGEKLVRRGKRRLRRTAASNRGSSIPTPKVAELLEQQRSKTSPLQSYRPAKGPRIVNPKDL